mmetsp:Transcript_8667/g.22112  ORF Transcript_8667/g.22112 Transcript_8667/m.22112 type:complete len:282 (+) Transcript_8667:1359-2204(+)
MQAHATELGAIEALDPLIATDLVVQVPPGIPRILADGVIGRRRAVGREGVSGFLALLLEVGSPFAKDLARRRIRSIIAEALDFHHAILAPKGRVAERGEQVVRREGELELVDLLLRDAKLVGLVRRHRSELVVEAKAIVLFLAQEAVVGRRHGRHLVRHVFDKAEVGVVDDVGEGVPKSVDADAVTLIREDVDELDVLCRGRLFGFGLGGVTDSLVVGRSRRQRELPLVNPGHELAAHVAQDHHSWFGCRDGESDQAQRLLRRIHRTFGKHVCFDFGHRRL